MSVCDDEDRVISRRFNPKSVNVLKLNRIVDCEIFVEECDFALGRITEELKDLGADKDWRASAIYASEEIAHKRSLAMKKLGALREQAEARAARGQPNYLDRFYMAAEKMLHDDQFRAIRDIASMISSERDIND